MGRIFPVISCVVLFFLFSSTGYGQGEKDTVFLANGGSYIGRIVEYKPDVEVSIVTEDGDALVVPISKVLRIARNTWVPTGGGRRVGERPSGHWTDSLTPGFYAAGSLLGSFSTDAGSFQANVNNVGSSSAGIIGSLAYGLGAYAKIGFIGRYGSSIYLNFGYGLGDYVLGYDRNLISHNSTRSVVGVGFGIEGRSLYVSSGINYIQNKYQFQYEFSSFPGMQSERFTGVGLSSHVLFALTNAVGIEVGPSLELMTIDNGGASFMRLQVEVGVSWSTILSKLNKYY